MTIMKKTVAAVLAASLLVGFTPSSAVKADGAASTRNILIGAAAATLIIVNHNRKVHEKYAQDAQTQAALEAQRNNAQAAYASEKKANENLQAANSELKREVAYQHDIVTQQNHQIAMMKSSSVGSPNYATTAKVASTKSSGGSHPQTVAVVSYGWGQI
jgi:ribose 5-phosphate isomerase